jgi:nicotinamide-nucleotide amidase
LNDLAREVGRRLRAAGELLVTAESCTGGWVSAVVTSVSGSSRWFERGFVTYSDVAKRQMLGVNKKTLRKHGAVSEETAREMAKGALKRSRGTIAVAVTGVAGPTGGSAAKPVGTVCISWRKGKTSRSETQHFKGNRESVRRQSVVRALDGVLELLDGG